MTDDLLPLRDVYVRLQSKYQLAVLEYAAHLLDLQLENARPATQFFICPICFSVGETPRVCHGQWMIACSASNPEDCKPLMDDDGELKGRAPRWFVEAALQRLTQHADDD